MEIFKNANPELLAIMAHPDNLPYLRKALGLVDLTIPGEDQRIKTHEDINTLVASEPIAQPSMDPMTGMPIEEEVPSIAPDPIIDQLPIAFEVCRQWLVSEAGRQTKIDNEMGYKNVLLYAAQCKMLIQEEMMQQQMLAAGSQATGEPGAESGPDETPTAPPITEAQDVQAVA